MMVAAALKIPYRGALPRLLHTAATPSDSAAAAEILAVLDSASPAAAAFDLALPRLSRAVAAAVVQRQPDRAIGFRFFVWASQWPRLRSKPCAAVIMGLIAADDAGLDLYWAALERAREAGLSVDSYPFWVMIKGLWNAGMDDKAVESFARMKEFPCVPDLATYNSILSLMVQKQVFLVALAVYNEMLKLNVKPDLTTYNVLLGGLCKSMRIKDALQMLEEMSQRGFVPDTVTHNILIDGLCRAGKVEQARGLFEIVEARNQVTHSAMLNGYCRWGRMEEAYAFVKASKRERGFSMDLESYSCLIDGLFRGRRFEEAHGWYRKALESGVVPDVVLQGIMIRGLAGSGRVGEALGLLNEMGVAANAHCHSAVVKGLCEAGLVGKARSLLRHDLANTYSYTILLDALCKKGLVGEAEEIFAEMEERCGPSVVSFNALIHGLCKANELRKAHLLFYKMEVGRAPSIFLRLSQAGPGLTASVQKLIASGQIHKAYRLVTRANQTRESSPDTCTYNTLIDGLCKSGGVNAAIKLFKDMHSKGLSPDSLTYGALIEGLQRSDREPDAFKLYNQMTRNGLAPKPDLVTQLMIWSCRRGKFALAFSVWIGFLETRPGKDSEAVEAAAEDFKNNRVEKAIRGLLKMDLKLNNDLDPGPYMTFLIGFCEAGKCDDALMIFAALQDHNVDVTPASCVKLIYALCSDTRLDLAVNVFLYALEKGFLIRKACNHLIKCLLCDRSKNSVAVDLMRKLQSSDLGIDGYLYPTTKLLLGFRIRPS